MEAEYAICRAQGCGCQWAQAGGRKPEITLTVPDCPIPEHAEDARKRVLDPGTPAEVWPDEDGHDRTAAPIE